jgi:transcriptional regulator with GAF, ATPase, and Fis domain
MSTFSSDLRRALLNGWAQENERSLEETRIREQMTKFGIVGLSPAMMAVFRWVIRVSALSDFPVLINGETGTGKELIARALYRLDSKRRKGPFVAANCGAISAGLAESELFGHRKGAFTGADSDRKGLFRSAESGVLFLDEIGDLDQSLQAKLLRVLQEDRVLGVGFDRDMPVDVRVIAATNKDLETMVKQGTFREDLYHRLSGLSIKIPPLRERSEDLRPLTEHFLQKYSALSPSGTPTVSADFLDALSHVKLSGNVRQLENIVRRALLSAQGNSPLSLGDLTHAEWEQLSEERTSTVFPQDTEPNGHDSEITDPHSEFLRILDLHDWNLSKSLEYCERSLLKCALELTQGNQSHTARLMGITPRSVYNKLHKHKLTP